MAKYFVKRLPKPVPEYYNNPHVDYWDGKDSTALYLISRDIQVGDRVFYIGRERSTDAKEYTVERAEYTSDTLGWNYFFNGQYNPLSIVLKVIGEISPEATWIKEGDEFNENEIKSYFSPKQVPKEQWKDYCVLGKNVLGKEQMVYPLSHSFCSSHWVIPENPLTHKYQIKGSCGHFH